MDNDKRRPATRFKRIVTSTLTWVALLSLIAGVVNMTHVAFAAATATRLAREGSKGSAVVQSKEVIKKRRRGSSSYFVRYRVTSPPGPEVRLAAVDHATWSNAQTGESVVYLYDSTDPAAGILAMEVYYLERWYRRHFAPLAVALGALLYLGWRLLSNLRGRAAGAQAG